MGMPKKQTGLHAESPPARLRTTVGRQCERVDEGVRCKATMRLQRYAIVEYHASQLIRHPQLLFV
jgi:hypothetical protein